MQRNGKVPTMNEDNTEQTLTALLGPDWRDGLVPVHLAKTILKALETGSDLSGIRLAHHIAKAVKGSGNTEMLDQTVIPAEIDGDSFRLGYQMGQRRHGSGTELARLRAENAEYCAGLRRIADRLGIDLQRKAGDV